MSNLGDLLCNCVSSSETNVLLGEALEGLIQGRYSLGTLNDEHATILSDIMEKSAGMRKLVASIIAEIAKDESVRHILSSSKLIEPLVEVLKTATDYTAIIEACRALANLCYDNDEARLKIHTSDGHQLLLDLIKRHSVGDEGFNQPDGSDRSHVPRLRVTTMGCLHNLINSNATLQKSVISLDPLPALVHCLRDDSPPLVRFTVLALSSLSELDECKTSLQSADLLVALLTLFLRDQSEPTSADSLDVMTHVADILSVCVGEKDELLSIMGSTGGVDQKLLSLVAGLCGSEHEEDKNLVTVLTDLVVRVLSCDAAMKRWFADGSGLVYITLKNVWLESPHSCVKLSAALGLGNFARRGSHCLTMVKDGLVLNALSRLSSLKSEMGDMSANPFIHTLLGLVGNIAFSECGSSYLLLKNSLDIILPYMDSVSTFVKGDTLGVCRKLIRHESSVATRLGSDPEFLSKVQKASGDSYNALLYGESRRLVASIVKNSPDVPVLRCVVCSDCLSLLGDLLIVPHPLMVNEALVALILISSILPSDESCQVFDKSEVISKLSPLLDEAAKGNFPVEVLKNTLAFCTRLFEIGLKAKVAASVTRDQIDKLSSHSNLQVRELNWDILKE